MNWIEKMVQELANALDDGYSRPTFGQVKHIRTALEEAYKEGKRQGTTVSLNGEDVEIAAIPDNIYKNIVAEARTQGAQEALAKVEDAIATLYVKDTSQMDIHNQADC